MNEDISEKEESFRLVFLNIIFISCVFLRIPFYRLTVTTDSLWLNGAPIRRHLLHVHRKQIQWILLTRMSLFEDLIISSANNYYDRVEYMLSSLNKPHPDCEE